MTREHKFGIIVVVFLAIIALAAFWVYELQPAARQCKAKGGAYRLASPHCIKYVTHTDTIIIK